MALSITTRPRGGVYTSVENSAVFGDLVGSLSVNKVAHGLNEGNLIYITSLISSYNGMWVVKDSGSLDYFEIRRGDGETAQAYIPTTSNKPLVYKVASFAIGYVNYNCIHLPIVYKLSNTKWPINTDDTVRSISSVADSNGYSALALSGDIKNTGSAAELEFIKITNSGASGSFPSYDGVYQIVAYTNETTFTISLAYDNTVDLSLTGASIQYYYNNYHIKVQVWGGLKDGHILESQKPYALISTLDFIPDEDGKVQSSINEILKSYIKINNNILLGTLPNNIDAFTNFYIKYAEVYDVGGTELSSITPSYTSDLAVFEGAAVNSKLPFKNIYSGFLSDYIIGLNTQQFLTTFDEPVIFTGKYFDLSFISPYYNNFIYPGLSTFVNDGSGDITWTTGPAPSVALGGADTISARLNAPITRIKNAITYRIAILLGGAISSNIELVAGFLNTAGNEEVSASSITGGTIFVFDIVGTGDCQKVFFKGEDLGGGGTITISDYWAYPINDTSLFNELLLRQQYYLNNVLQSTTEIAVSNNDEGVYRQQLTDPPCTSDNLIVTLYRKEIAVLALPSQWSNFSAGTAFDTKGFSSFTESVTTVSVSPAIAYTPLATAAGETVRLTIPITVSGGATFTTGIRVNVFLADGAGSPVSNLSEQTITADGSYTLSVVLLATGTGARIYVQCIRDGLSAGTAVVVITIPETITIQKTDAISESQTINIDCKCVKTLAETYYMSWMNYLGGFEYWYFTGYSDELIDITDSGDVEENIFPEWPNSYGEFADTITKQTFRDSTQQRVLRSQYLTESQLQGLKYIKTSPLVQIVNSIYDRRTVLVDTDSFTCKKEGDKLYTVTLTITYTDDVPSQRV